MSHIQGPSLKTSPLGDSSASVGGRATSPSLLFQVADPLFGGKNMAGFFFFFTALFIDLKDLVDGFSLVHDLTTLSTRHSALLSGDACLRQRRANQTPWTVDLFSSGYYFAGNNAC